MYATFNANGRYLCLLGQFSCKPFFTSVQFEQLQAAILQFLKYSFEPF